MTGILPRSALLVCLISLFACIDDEQIVSDNQRPYDPWVSRSVVDQKPRMITLALDEDLWAAYSTTDCSLYKAWKGYVNFEGAVFNTAHGPQPVSVGDAYLVNIFEHPWRITRGGAELSTTAEYAGHRFVNGYVQLMYDLRAEGLGPIRVYEQVEAVSSKSGSPGLERIFITANVADGIGVILKTNINAIVSQKDIQTDGDLSVYEEEKKTVDGRELIEMEGHLALRPNAETSFTVYFEVDPTIDNEIGPSGEEEDELAALGYRLIARSDCKTCHNTNVKTIGPAYVDIAERYAATEDNINQLANKVIKGGAGIWGIQVMSAHPNLAMTDAKEMVKWILSLDTDEREIVSDNGDAISLEATEVDPSTVLPGAITHVYELSGSRRTMPAKPDRAPDMAGIMPEFGNLSGADFVDLSENFAVYGTGYLYFDQSGTYTMRLWSDDGSKLYINDQLIIDHDGIHGTTYQEQDITVDEGYYPFRLEYFQGLGDKFLSLNVRVPVQSEFMTIPSTMYFHSISDRQSLAGYSLPMSVANRMPGDQLPLEDVHPSYDLFQARPYDFLPKVGGLDVLSDGTVAICTWDPTGSVYLVKNATAENPNDISVLKIAEGFAEPLGLKVVDDEIYVLQKQELTKLVDTDGDNLTDEYRLISNGWKTSANFHEFAFGLEYRDGYFYANLATAIDPGGASSNPQIEDRGKVMKINAQTGEVEFIAHGLRTPNGIGFGVDGELFVSDNQGDWLPSSKILHVVPGAWFGSRSVDFEGTEGLEEQPPLVWLPQDEIGNSPSTPMLLEDGPYAGQMMHGEVTHGGVKRVFVEKINGEYQGAVFRFIQGLEAGVNRMAYADDGSLYVGGIGNPGNWAQTGKLWYGLQRLKYNGESTFEMLAVRAKSNGVEIEFTEPLEGDDGWDASEFEVRQWKYVPTVDYGGPKVDEKELEILSSSVSDDRKRVFLELEGMQEGHVLYVHLLRHFVSEPGHELWSTEAWYTMNQIPEDSPGTTWARPTGIGPNTLTTAEKENGWRLLFDGETFQNWKRFKKEDIGQSWVVENGAIKLNAKLDKEGKWFVEDRGDLITQQQFEDFELKLEWKISNCGNSGIMFSVIESDEYTETWQTGPEMQVLDNTCHPDARYRTHRAGDLYDMVEARHERARPAGEWNQVRLVKIDGVVEHWLNGVKIVEYEMYTDTWDKMIANSKFKDMPGFGKARKGHIALQDHGDAQVWYRDIKIREF